MGYLGWAVTCHRAQGVTVGTCHTLVTPATTRENLHVAMTRGRDSNTAYVATDRPDTAAERRDAARVQALAARAHTAEPPAAAPAAPDAGRGPALGL
ncbi:MAG: hypothetical protein LBG60_16695 [Bifidobacteriaceae bacterium]|nr:hypothetical protein [Bifidobacteriaceae bacterium]